MTAVEELLRGVDIASVVIRRPGSLPAPAVSGHLRTVTLRRTLGSLGVKIRTDDESIGAFVQEVLPEGVAATKGIHAGDRLIFIDGQDVRKATHEDIVEALKGKDKVRQSPAPGRRPPALVGEAV